MLITAVLAVTLGLAGSEPSLYCPATLEAIKGAPANQMEYGGAIFGTCCGGCEGPFSKDPATLIAKAIQAKKTVGLFGYDPVSGMKIDAKAAVAYSDYMAIRYRFKSAAEKTSFDKTPSKFVGPIKGESYECPVTGDKMTAETAQGYADYKGIRYYLCCPQCNTAFRKSPAKFAATVAASVKPLSVSIVK